MDGLISRAVVAVTSHASSSASPMSLQTAMQTMTQATLHMSAPASPVASRGGGRERRGHVATARTVSRCVSVDHASTAPVHPSTHERSARCMEVAGGRASVEAGWHPPARMRSADVDWVHLHGMLLLWGCSTSLGGRAGWGSGRALATLTVVAGGATTRLSCPAPRLGIRRASAAPIREDIAWAWPQRRA